MQLIALRGLRQQPWPIVDHVAVGDDQAVPAHQDAERLGDHRADPARAQDQVEVGPGGYAYVVDLVDRIEPDDHVFESHGVKVIVSDEALKLVDGTEIDYRKDGLNESFHFQNPKVKDT